MNLFFKKCAVLFLVAAVFGGLLFVPKKTSAQYAVFDAANLSEAIVEVGTTISQWVEENYQKILRDILAKRIIDYTVDQTVQWIQGGGQPKFITNWKGFVSDAGNIAFDSIIREVGLARLCQPFSLQVRIGLLPVGQFSQRVECTLDRVVGNIENFYRNFQSGGWIAYNEMWNPRNNFFGQILMIQDETGSRVSQETTAAINKGIAGAGFLSDESCVEVNEEMYDSCIEDESYNSPETAHEDCEQYACTRWETQTPGSIVGKAAGEAITSDKEWAANIQSWTSALVNAAINRVISEGLASMRGAGSGGGSSYRPPEMTTQINQQIDQERRRMTNEIQRFRQEWEYISTAKTRSLSYVQQTLNIYDSLILNNCGFSASAPEIQALQNTSSTLIVEISALRSQLDEARILSNRVSAYQTYAEQGNTAAAFNDFMIRYNTQDNMRAIIQGTNRQAADAQATQLQRTLEDAQNRLNICLNSGGGA